jgi:hypothetical protein
MNVPFPSAYEIATGNRLLGKARPQDLLRWAVEQFRLRLTLATVFGADGAA